MLKQLIQDANNEGKTDKKSNEQTQNEKDVELQIVNNLINPQEEKDYIPPTEESKIEETNDKSQSIENSNISLNSDAKKSSLKNSAFVKNFSQSIKKTGVIGGQEANFDFLVKKIQDKRKLDIENLAHKKALERKVPLWIIVVDVFFIWFSNTNILLQVYLESQTTLYIIYGSATIIRVIWWVFLGYKISPKLDSKHEWVWKYVCIDDLSVLTLLTLISYCFQNNSATDTTLAMEIIADVSLIFLLHSWNGAIRCLTSYMIWNNGYYNAYRFISYYSISLNMVVAGLTLVNGLDNFDKDMYLLYIFTNIGYLCQVFSIFNDVEVMEFQNQEPLLEQ